MGSHIAKNSPFIKENYGNSTDSPQLPTVHIVTIQLQQHGKSDL